MKNFAAALSEHPIPALAVGEVAGQILEDMGQHFDLLCIFVTSAHAGALEDIAAAAQTLLKPKAMIGCAAEAIVGPGREIEHGPAISVWAGNVGFVDAMRLDHAVPLEVSERFTDAIVIADPFSFSALQYFSALADRSHHPKVAGGMASSAQGPGGNRLVLNGEVFSDGAVAVLIDPLPAISLERVVAQGCRPIGQPFVVTAAEGNVIYELGGSMALSRLNHVINTELTDEDMVLAHEGILIGRVIDEHKEDFDRDDFLVRSFLGANSIDGSITVGDEVEVGTTIQFHLRDADDADNEMRVRLAQHQADAALLFTCNGRGTDLFEEPNHDAQIIDDMFDGIPTAGFYANGEFGAVGTRNLIHDFAASMALFRTTDDDESHL